MAKASVVICPSCGYKNQQPLARNRCVSCGVHIEEFVPTPGLGGEEGSHYQQRSFDLVWFLIAIVIMVVLTGAIVIGLPRVVPVLDFEGSAGMLVAIPVWFTGGLLVGLISPGRTFVEPVAAVFLVALPTAFLLHQGQTVKTMPAFMYVLFAALGVLFTLVGAYAGERLQLGSPQS